MIDTTQSDTVEITLHVTERYREQVLADEPDSWIQISVRIGDGDVCGGDDGKVTGFACSTVLELLDSVRAIEREEPEVLTFDSGLLWLAIEPTGDDAVAATYCLTFNSAKNPGQRGDLDGTRHATRDAWSRGVLDAVRDYYGTVTQINPELDAHETIAEIRDEIDEVDSLVR